MSEKMPNSTKAGMTRSSSYLDSIYGEGSFELVWENGKLHVQQGCSSSSVPPQVAPSCKGQGYSIKAIDEGAFNAKGASLSSVYSLMDLPVQRDSSLENSRPNTHQSNDQSSCHPTLERVEDIKTSMFAEAASSSKGPDKSSVINSSKGSQGRQNPLVSDASNLVPRSEETPSDEQSEAIGHNSALNILGSRGQYFNQTSGSPGVRAKRKTDTKKYCDEALLESSSLCSLGASNNINICSGKHDDIDDSMYLSDNNEKPEDLVVKEKPAREGTGVKRIRNVEVHNLCERKRRDKINKRMRMLTDLIPNCNKTDKASMLDDAIEYLKTLKLQLQFGFMVQVMSMGPGFCMPFIMLPNAAHHMINTAHLHQLMGVGMGFRPGTVIPCSLPQFPTTPLPGITDNRVHMFGIPNQVPPMPISHPPFIPMVGSPSTQPPMATTNLAQNPASSQLTTLMASVPNNSNPVDKLNMQQSKHQIRFPFTTSH